MEQNTLKFEPDQPVKVILQYDQPKTGTSTTKDNKTFTWYLYGCYVDGQGTAFFASENISSL